MQANRVGIKQVAERAGVSLGTVSNVLNRPDRVAAGTRARVLRVIAETGFVRNGSASRLRASHNNALGLVVLDNSNPFFTDVARGVEEVAEEFGYVVMLCNSDGTTAREERHLRFLEEQRVAGLLITPTAGRAVAQRLRGLRGRGMSVVLVDEPTDRHDECCVAVDDTMGGELVGRHLLELGARRIVYVTFADHIRQFEDRRRGLMRSIGAADAEVILVSLSDLNGRGGYAAVPEILSHRPDAVFCGNDIVALGVLRGLIESDINVPDEIALVGYDDIEFANIASIPLTTVRQPAHQIGRTAAKLILEECSGGEHAHQQVTFRPELVVRQSTVGDKRDVRVVRVGGDAMGVEAAAT